MFLPELDFYVMCRLFCKVDVSLMQAGNVVCEKANVLLPPPNFYTDFLLSFILKRRRLCFSRSVYELIERA